MFNRHRKLRMEQMEAREMMAATATSDLTGAFGDQTKGDVYAYVQSGNLFVNESINSPNSGNGVRVSQLSNGSIRVEGIQSNDGTGRVSKINGQAFQDFVVTGGLNVNLGGGGDNFQLGYVGGSSTMKFTQIQVDVAAPQTLSTGLQASDDDQVMLWAGQSQGAVSINTGRGNDLVFVGNLVVGGKLRADMSINTGAGTDEVDIKGASIHGNLDIQTYANVSETDVDSVYFDTLTFLDPSLNHGTFVTGNVNVRTGGGDDSFISTDPNKVDANVTWLGAHVYGSMTVDTGAGNDYAFLRNLRVDSDFSLNMGGGADTLEMRQSPIEGEFGYLPAVGGNMSIQMFAAAGENDIDSVTMYKIGVVGNVNIAMGDGNDVLTLTTVGSKAKMTLDAGAGSDTVKLNDVSAYDDFYANLGDGNDTLDIVDLYDFFGMAKIDGGAGTDRLTRSGAIPTNFTQLAFEWINGVPQPGNVVLPVNTNATQIRS